MKSNTIRYTPYFALISIFLVILGIMVGISFKNQVMPPKVDEKQVESSEPISFIDWIQKEEQNVYDYLNTTYGIDRNTLEKGAQDYINTAYKNDTHYHEKDLNSSIKEVIEKVCNDFGITSADFSIRLFTDISPAAANEKTLYINQPLFLKLSQKAQCFIIAHELRHYINKDVATHCALDSLLKKNPTKIPFDQKDRNHPINRFTRFYELRADIEAASKNAFYAECYKAFTQETLGIMGDTPGISHPKNSYRLALSGNIGAEFNAVA